MQFPKKIRIRLNTMLISPSKLYTSKPITHSSPKAKGKLIDSSQAKSYDQKLKGARIMFQVQHPKWTWLWLVRLGKSGLRFWPIIAVLFTCHSNKKLFLKDLMGQSDALGLLSPLFKPQFVIFVLVKAWDLVSLQHIHQKSLLENRH